MPRRGSGHPRRCGSPGLQTELLSPNSFFHLLRTQPSPGIFPDTQPAPLREASTGMDMRPLYAASAAATNLT